VAVPTTISSPSTWVFDFLRGNALDAKKKKKQKPGKPPAFQWYPKDFLSDANVIRMTLEQKGAYIVLISICWLEGSIPADRTAIAQLSGYSPKDNDPVLKCFEKSRTKRNFLIHPRLEVEKVNQAEHRKAKSLAGIFGNDVRWHNVSHSDRKAIAQRSQSDPNAIAKDRSASASSVQELKTTLPFVFPVPVGEDRDPPAGEVNGNVISKAPEPKPEKPKALTLEEIELVDRVVHFTNAPDHRPLFQKAVRIMGAGQVEMAMSQTKTGHLEGIVQNKAAALIGTINQWLLEYQRNAKRNGENERPGEYTNLKKRTRTIKLP